MEEGCQEMRVVDLYWHFDEDILVAERGLLDAVERVSRMTVLVSGNASRHTSPW